ncbi:RRS1 protein, partial [Irena cyanogastra]|nr:RRS1 protein [Irena cyanogastra]
VEAVLAAAEEQEAEKRRSITVEKELELEYDLGNLLAVDRNPPPAAALREAGPRREALLRALARDNTQLLVSRLWELPAERAGGAGGPLVAQLPEPTFRLPREKPPPKPRPPTRWEQFARLKGIRRKKKTSLPLPWRPCGWRRCWRPPRSRRRRSGGASRWKRSWSWSADPEEDQFARLRREKRERVARNELNRLRNLARAHRAGSAVPAAPLHPTGHQDRDELRRVARVARVSTASLGRFQPRLPKESAEPPSRSGGKKRRFEPLLGNLAAERSRQLELLRDMGSKKPVLDITRAVNKQLRQEEAEAAAANKGKKQSKRGKRGRRQQRPGRSGKKSGARRQPQQQKPAGGGTGG